MKTSFAALFIILTLSSAATPAARKYNAPYEDDYLNYVAFPLGGIGTGMVCLQGHGALGSFVLHYEKPNMYNDPMVFSAICVKGERTVAKVLEGPIPKWKIYGNPSGGHGLGGTTYGLPRFDKAVFTARFPFATIKLTDGKIPLDVTITGWSPFTPPDANDSSLPVASLEYTFKNRTDKTIEAVYSFNSENLMYVREAPKGGVREIERGFIFHQPSLSSKPYQGGDFAVWVDSSKAKVNCAWFRGGWFDKQTIVWKDIEEGKCYAAPATTEGAPSPGATIFVPLELKPGDQKTVTVKLAWYVPETHLRFGKDRTNPDAVKTCAEDQGCGLDCAVTNETHKPWYAAKFSGMQEVVDYWEESYSRLKSESESFRDCFYDTTLPPEVVEAIAANLTIIKSPTVLRQTDGRLWCFEGCDCCMGSCTHVWNYAQAFCNLFPSLERTLRDTEFGESLASTGFQIFRSSLPIRPTAQLQGNAAADGQLGGIMKIYRDWRISGDTTWLKRHWPCVKVSLDYCIEAWDPEHKGYLHEPHHNTYDIEFWGPDGMCGSFYLGALKAAIEMGKALGDETPLYAELFEKGQKYINDELFNGEYFYQRIQWQGLRAKDPTKAIVFGGAYSPEAVELLKKEGPKYQYGQGCLSDGVLGAWMASLYGLGDILDPAKVASHLASVHKYNLRKDLSDHANPQRPTYAMGAEGGLLLCTWPKGGKLSLPFVYSNEVWTGIEYQVASHLIMNGMVDEGLEIVRVCRDRYDGRARNPFNEYECGNWYARAMSSYALIQSLTGAQYDAIDGVLYIAPQIKGDFRSFFCTASGYGTVGVRDSEPFLDTKMGNIPFTTLKYTPN